MLIEFFAKNLFSTMLPIDLELFFKMAAVYQKWTLREDGLLHDFFTNGDIAERYN